MLSLGHKVGTSVGYCIIYELVLSFLCYILLGGLWEKGILVIRRTLFIFPCDGCGVFSSPICVGLVDIVMVSCFTMFTCFAFAILVQLNGSQALDKSPDELCTLLSCFHWYSLLLIFLSLGMAFFSRFSDLTGAHNQLIYFSR